LSAIPRPIPRAAPVTIAFFPLSSTWLPPLWKASNLQLHGFHQPQPYRVVNAKR
jgi:hypothetical protein